MRQRAVSRPIARRKGTFYQSIRSIAAQRGAPYDAPPSAWQADRHQQRPRELMLRGIRKASSNWLGRAVMGVVMLRSLPAASRCGASTTFSAASAAPTLPRSATRKFLPTNSARAYNDRLRQLGQQLGRPIPPEQANALGLDRQVLGQMIAEAGFDQIARKMRLGIPDAEIVKHVMSDPHFQTPTGQFDRTLFQYFLRNIGFSEQRFFDEQRRSIPRREITDAISGGVQVPKALPRCRQSVPEPAAQHRLSDARPGAGRRHCRNPPPKS